jgi:hypothetical protein
LVGKEDFILPQSEGLLSKNPRFLLRCFTVKYLAFGGASANLVVMQDSRPRLSWTGEGACPALFRHESLVAADLEPPGTRLSCSGAPKLGMND